MSTEHSSFGGGALRVRSWLVEQALPLWSSLGVDHNCGGFFERLTEDGAPDQDCEKRAMVQARQIFVYSHAAFANLHPQAIEIAVHGFDFLTRFAAPDGGQHGFVHRLSPAGDVRDPVRDLYDHAFLLFAFSWLYRASGWTRVRAAIDDVMGVIEALHCQPPGSFLEVRGGRSPRRQNPHMHLLEAFLAAYAATGEERFLARAGCIVGLLARYFFDPNSGMLLEYFDDHLQRASGDAGEVVEPGHHFEWVWLITQYDTMAGEDHRDLVAVLYERACRCGLEAGSGLVLDEIDSCGAVRKATKRLWPQSEAVKAHRAMGQAAAARAAVGNLFEYFLDRAPAGAWRDRLMPDNRPVAGPIPASSLYHIYLGFSDYLGMQMGEALPRAAIEV